MFARQYDSLTGAVAFQVSPDDSIIVTGNANAVVSLVEAKSVLRVNHNEDNDYIEELIDATTEQVERYIHRDMTIKTRKGHWSRPAYLVALPYGPHGNITNFVSIDCDDVVTNVTEYQVIGLAQKKIKINESVSQIQITFQSGYSVVPDTVKTAILQEISFQYKNRQDPDSPRMVSVNGLSLEARQLLYSYRPFL